MKVIFTLCVVWLLGLSSLANSSNPNTYKAAVLEHPPRPYADSPLASMLTNVKAYVEAAAKAGRMGADILAFPEYGIVGLENPPNLGEKGKEFFVYLPPEAVGNDWVPCKAPTKFGEGNDNHKILELLSCAALDNSLVLLANLLTTEPCSETNDISCPSHGFYQFNTNIIFSKNGTLLARYHKRHLYFEEENLNPAPKDEFEIIDVGFMKFGTFTCFDAVWKDPIIDYVEHGIRNLVFASAWGNEMPFLTSPQLNNRMARGLGINLIVPNMYAPRISRLGSGIYSSSKGVINETYDLSTPGKLLIAELPLDPPTIVDETMECPLIAQNQSLPTYDRPYYIPSIMSNQPSSRPSESINQLWFQRLRNFSHVFLNSKEDDISLCDSDLCCHLSYSLSEKPSQDLYVFAINNAFHPYGRYRMYSQICSVMRCENDYIETCGRVPLKSVSAIFDRLTLSGSFAATTLYPSILATDLQLIPDAQWEFSKGDCSQTKDGMKYGGRISLTSAPAKPIMVASIYGRDFDRD